MRKQTSIHQDHMYIHLYFIYFQYISLVIFFTIKPMEKKIFKIIIKIIYFPATASLKSSHHLIAEQEEEKHEEAKQKQKQKLFIQTLTHSRTNEENLFIFIRTWCLIEHFRSKHKGDKKNHIHQMKYSEIFRLPFLGFFILFYFFAALIECLQMILSTSFSL